MPSSLARWLWLTRPTLHYPRYFHYIVCPRCPSYRPKNQFAPFFETVIRYLGGLLSAYALSNNTVLLHRADDLALKLDTVFNTPSGFPFFAVNTVTCVDRLHCTYILANLRKRVHARAAAGHTRRDCESADGVYIPREGDREDAACTAGEWRASGRAAETDVRRRVKLSRRCPRRI